MSRSGEAKIPNMTAMAVPAQVRPSGVPGKTESGGAPIAQANEVKGSDVLAPGGFTGSVVTGHNAELNAAPKRYRVVKPGHYKAPDGPQKHLMYEGKIVDDSNYDIKSIRAQGIKLVEIDEQDNPKS